MMSKSRQIDPASRDFRPRGVLFPAKIFWLIFLIILVQVSSLFAITASNVKERRLSQLLESYEIQNIEPREFIRKVHNAEPVSLNIRNREFRFQLTLRDLRSPRYRAETTLADGIRVPVAVDTVESYAANLPGGDGGQARFTLRGNSIEGVILTRDEWYFVEPLNHFSADAPGADYITYRRSDLRADAIGACAGALSHRLNQGIDLPLASYAANPLPSAASSYIVEIATEADYEYVNTLGGASQANSEILSILNQVEGVYQTELGISFSVVYQHTWTDTADPYSSTSPNTMLQEFTNYWNSNFTSTNYDLAHMWTGRDMDGSTVGIAWRGVICFKSYSYGVSQRMTGTPAKFIVTAHEMGHNFGATHPDQETPAHTECANTIMNSMIGSGFTFCQFSLDQINATLTAGAPCLSQGGGSTTSPPSNLTATAASASRIDLSWQDNSSNETGFKIQRKTGVSGTFSQVASTSVNVTSYADTGLAAGTTYYYKVQASDSGGDTTFSNEAQATTHTVSTGPSIASFTPASGPVGTQVTITGSNLAGASVVKFNNWVSSFTVLSSTQISATVPAGATSGQISVTTSAGTAFSATNFQVSNCSYSLSTYNQTFEATGGVGTLQILSGNSCGWIASSSSSWIVINSGSSGSGNGTLSYSVSANTSLLARSGLITVADAILSIYQTVSQPSCNYSLSSSSETFNANGGTDSFSVFTSGSCAWTAVSNAAWITLLTGAIGTGDGTVSFQIARNTGGTARSGQINVAGNIYTIAQSAAPSGNATNTIFLPIILSAAGAGGSYYSTEMTLTNRGISDATLDFYYTSSFGSGTGHAATSLGAGKQLLIPNATEYLRGLGIPIGSAGSQGGTLRVKFSSLSSPADGAVTTRISTAVQGGKAGLAYNGILLPFNSSEPVYLCGLRQNSTDRSNLALQNAGDSGSGEITLRITLYSGNRNNPAAQVLPLETLAAGGFKQISEILSSNGLSFPSGYAKVERISGSAPFYTYAVINDQVTSDGSFVPPVLETSLNGKHKSTLPVVVENPTFSSELIVTNWSSSPRALSCTFVADSVQGPNSAAVFSLDLQPGEQLIIPKFVDWLRNKGVSGVGTTGITYVGPLFAETLSGDLSGVALMARTSSAGGGGHYGLFYNSLPEGTASVNVAWIYGLQQNNQSRTNLALINTGEVDNGNDSFQIDIYDGLSGSKVNNTGTLTLKAKGWMQINSFLSQYASLVSQGYIRITRTAGNNPFIAYAVINDGAAPGQGTGDGAFLPATP